MNLKTTFTAPGATLQVIARSTRKSGVSTFIRTKQGAGKGSPKAVVGMRQVHSGEGAEAAAQARYDQLVTDVTAKGGWTLGSAKVGGGGTFSTIPDAPTEAPAVDGAPVTEAPKTNGKKNR